jgi:hypothetical protein
MRRLAAFLFVLAAAPLLAALPIVESAWAQFNVMGNGVANPWTLTTEYSADVVIVNNGQTINSRVNRTPNALRSETPQGGGQTVTAIVRLDRNLGWVLIPGTRNAAEVDLTGFPLVLALLRNPTATATAEGTETIDGMAVTRWRVQGGDPGARFDGRVWATAEGVVVKVEGVADVPQGRQQFSLVAHNIRIARQAPGLFEIPNGYQRIQVPPQLLQAMMGGGLR